MFRIPLLTLSVVLLVSPIASADLVYSFGETNYEVAAGGLLNVELYLVQTNAAVDPVDLSVDGLFNGGVRVFFDDNAISDRAQIKSLTDIIPNPLFDDTLFGATLDLDAGVSAGFSDSIDDLDAPVRGSRILLGTFVFTAGDVIGEVTNLRATDFDPDLDDVIANDLDATSLDNLIGMGNATISVSAVPEPSGLTLFALAGLGVMAKRRRLSTETCCPSK